MRHSLPVSCKAMGRGLDLGTSQDTGQLATHHLQWCQDEDDVANFATVFTPVLWPLQSRDADVASQQVLDIAAVEQWCERVGGGQRERD